MTRLQIHIPISPSDSFFTMIQCYAASLRTFGGAFRDARIVVSVGGDCEPFDIAAKRPELNSYGIVWRWVPRDAFRKHSYFATGLDRWAEPFECDYVLMADADTLILGPIDDAVKCLAHSSSIAGVIATFPPFYGRNSGNDRVRWPELFERAGLPPPAFDHAIPGHGVFYPKEEMSHAPPYYNFGFVIGSRDAMNAIRTTFAPDVRIALEYMSTDLHAQAGLCLSIVRHRIAATTLPVRFNFWSHPTYLEHFPGEAEALRVLHYLGGPFRKHTDNHSVADIAAWLAANSESSDMTTKLVHKAFSQVLGALR